MTVPIVTTPARTHLVKPETIVRRRGLTTGFTACGRYLAQLTQRADALNHFGTHEAGDLAAGVTCKTCRKVLGITDPRPNTGDRSVRVEIGSGMAEDVLRKILPPMLGLVVRVEFAPGVEDIDFTGPVADGDYEVGELVENFPEQFSHAVKLLPWDGDAHDEDSVLVDVAAIANLSIY
jgi:hypothetical protein